MKLSATVKEAVADAEVQISQEEVAEARPRTPGPRTRQDGRAEQPDVRQRPLGDLSRVMGALKLSKARGR